MLGAECLDYRTWEFGALFPVATHSLLCHLNLIEQIGMTIKHFEQFDQG
jgi:hypothetical protein